MWATDTWLAMGPELGLKKQVGSAEEEGCGDRV